ncbi:hypothetical protein DPMN_133956 [Dreissena polymorpha]|uniref:Uncharacterized protein n=1 Tax=Dreissena polymorpha TaxID=45954 RepID=A0A9D4FWI1_DREPO|nr:hypothetical protein DPMN_133956 [Dreissena polymorpha]
MKLKSIRSERNDISSNPETFSTKVSEQDMTDMLTNKIQDDTEVESEEWQRVEVEGKKKMKIVKSKYRKEEYIKHTQLQFQDFLQHVSWVKTQYTAIRNLKARLPRNEILIHMEFAENFTCINADEVQALIETAQEFHCAR